MIKRQYIIYEHGYFYNFINRQDDMEASIELGLKKYKATLAKTKAPQYKLNVKWHDAKLYTLFVMQWSK